ncbi:hypothetical protein SO694_000671116 [Aureococcus anophagefferens]|uniref:Uncharacterized protein n=1 Tax=Aureococcus anophagefferens TaxID=44056 RepID=A0ABR1FQH6_AURAN
MKRFEEQRRHQRRASTVEMNPEFEQKLGRFKPPAISDDDLKIMTIQRNAALLMREHPSLKRILKNHDFDRDLPDADRLHQVAMLFETGGLGIRRRPGRAPLPQVRAVLGHHRSQGVMGEYYETGTTEQRNPRRARALYRESRETSRAATAARAMRPKKHRPREMRERRKGAREPRNARLLFEKAAKRREKCAQAALGYMYEKGEGRCEGDLKTDYNHAKRYYGMAANQGCERSAGTKRAEALGYAREQRIAHIATLDAASPEPTVEEKKKEADSDVDEMMDSDNDGDDERAGARGSEGASILGSLNIR